MPDFKIALLTKIQTRDLQAAVIGLGYVGLPLAVELAKAGYRTVGIDLDRRKVEAINAGRSTIEDVPTAEVAPLVRAGTLRATTDISVLY
jgi:UDP-N-acetyl-D-mannosaminuronate dehydrogenase